MHRLLLIEKQNKDSIDWRVELDELAKMNISCFGVQCGNNKYADEFYQEIGDKTHGQHLRLTSFKNMPQIFVAICLKRADPTGETLKEYQNKLEENGDFNREQKTAFAAIMTTAMFMMGGLVKATIGD